MKNDNISKIDEIENRYDFIPNEASSYVAQNSINKICLKTTKNIANAKQKGLETQSLEKRLREYRDYGAK